MSVGNSAKLQLHSNVMREERGENDWEGGKEQELFRIPVQGFPHIFRRRTCLQMFMIIVCMKGKAYASSIVATRDYPVPRGLDHTCFSA